MASTFVDGGAAARGRAERHFDRCGLRPMTAPPRESHALATDVLTLLAMLRTREQERDEALAEARRLREQLDAARDTAETQRRIATIRENVGHIARGCRASTGHNPAPYLNSIEAALNAIARAALGVEGEQEKP
jgi:hypothetical protein